MKMIYAVIHNQHDEENIDTIICGERIKGCRNNDAIISGSATRSCGLFAIMSCYGIILSLERIIWNESPTYILIRLCNLIWRYSLYFQRVLCVFGYDMACNIIHRLLGDKMHDWAVNDDDFLTQKVIYTCLAIGLAKWFIDKWHGVRHKSDVCCKESGCLHPDNTKFRNVGMKKSNHNVVEHTWRYVNKLKPLLNCGHRKFTFAINLYKDYFNERRRKFLEAKNHTWDNLMNFKVINPGLSQCLFNHWQKIVKLISKNKIKGCSIRPTWHEFINSYNGSELSDTIPQMTRISFKRTIKYPYKNVWLKNDYRWNIDDLSFSIIESCNVNVFEYLKINLKNKYVNEGELIKNIGNLIKNVVKKEFNEKIYNKYTDFINVYKGIIDEYIKQYFIEQYSIRYFIKSNLMKSLFGKRCKSRPANFFDKVRRKKNYTIWMNRYREKIKQKKENDSYHKILANIQNLVDMKETDEYYYWFFPHDANH